MRIPYVWSLECVGPLFAYTLIILICPFPGTTRLPAPKVAGKDQAEHSAGDLGNLVEPPVPGPRVVRPHSRGRQRQRVDESRWGGRRGDGVPVRRRNTLFERGDDGGVQGVRDAFL